MARTADEILRDNLNKTLWTFINTYPVAFQSDKMLKDWIIDAMKDYHKEKLREELLLFAKYINKIGWSIPKNEVDDYLKSR